MQNARLSQTMRQSIVGLLSLLSVGVLIYLILWLRDFRIGGRSYKAIIEFTNAGGMTAGTPVAYRGVRVGQVTRVEPQTQSVEVEVEITPADRLIPSNSLIEANQSGLIGETSIDITPLEDLPAEGVAAKPLDSNCNSDIIICNGSRLEGQAKLDVNQLIRSLLRIANIIGSTEFAANFNAISRNASNTLIDLSQLSNEILQQLERKSLDSTLTSVSFAADEIGSFIANNRSEFSSTIKSVGVAADEISLILANNRTQLVATLKSIESTSNQLQTVLQDVGVVVNEVQQTELIKNLETLSATAVKLGNNLETLSAQISDPANSAMIEEILASARASFQNLSKITSDVDEITGNPEFRRNLQRVIDGLGNLLSSTQQLEQQAIYSHMLTSITAKSKITGNNTPILIPRSLLPDSPKCQTSQVLKP